MPKRGATDLSGILAVDKPTGMTSHDVVAIIRRATGEGRVGHAGTLDPLATGLLVVLVGPATRLEPFLSSSGKVYIAEIQFGASTDTDDSEGVVQAIEVVPHWLFEPEPAEELLAKFRGTLTQTPPAFSAVKVDGRTSHRVARSGGEVELEPREVEVYDSQITSFDEDERTWKVEFAVSKGTYIRALARDIALEAGTLGHITDLRRTVSGNLTLARHARPLQETVEAAREGRLGEMWIDPVAALGLPTVEADPVAVADGRSLPLMTGAVQPVEASEVAASEDSGEVSVATRGAGMTEDQATPPTVETLVSVVSPGGALLAVYRVGSDALRPVTVIPGGVQGAAR